MTRYATFCIRTRKQDSERFEHVGGGTRAAMQELLQFVPSGEVAELYRRSDGAVVARAWRDQYGLQRIEY